MGLLLSLHVFHKALDGDQTAKNEILVMSSHKITSIVRKYIFDRDDQKDVVQDASIHLLLNLHKYEPGRGEFGAWLHRLISNFVLGYLKRNRNYQSSMLPIETLEFDVNEEHGEDEILNDDIVAGFLGSLPKGARNVFNMFYIEGYKHHEIASLLEISINTSKAHAFRAKNSFIGFFKKLQLANAS
jgi:RNA polymerase sigma-70 factor, ECF subfamily